MRIHTYFENLYDYSYPVLCKFKDSWESKGYEVVVHTFHQALGHPLLKEYLASIERFPVTNRIEYELCCFRRWLAYDFSIKDEDIVILADYDIINVSLTEFPKYTVPTEYYAVGLLQIPLYVVRQFIHFVISIPDWRLDPKHNSDMTLMINHFTLPKQDYSFVSEWPDTSKPLIHFRGTGKKRELICFKFPL